MQVNQTAFKKIISLLFDHLLDKPKLTLAVGLVTIVVFASFLPKLTIDPRAESFLPEDSAALLYRDKVEDTFGLTDPMVIAVVNDKPYGVFNPKTLELVEWLTLEVEKIPAIDSDRILSLATEDNISGNEEGMQVEPFFETLPETQAEADVVRQAILDFPLYLGSMVSRDQSTTLIVTEVDDEDQAPKLYRDLLELVERAPIADGEKLYVAGDGAVSGYLVTYINADAARLVPVSVIIITLLCMVAFRTKQGVILPGLVIVASTTAAVGLMAALGDPVYVITTSMPILLVGIAVADSIHILSEYYEEYAKSPNTPQKELVINSISKMWRPVLLTTITSMIGFLGIYISSYMPPMQSFGLYSMVGLAMAGVFSLIVLPAAQMLFKPVPSPAFKEHNENEKLDYFAEIMKSVGSVVMTHSKVVIAVAAVVCLMGVIGAMHLQVNEAWVDNFRKSEPIYQADQAINRSLDGTNNLDIVIETPHPEDLFKPANLEKIEKLQEYVATLPTVGGSTSIVDYIKQMNRSLNEDKLSEYRIPDNPDLISQYFLLYSTSGDPTDFEEEIDYDYQMALVRVRLNTGRFQSFKPVVESIQQYVDTNFDDENIKASLSGRVYVDYEWLENLISTHFKGVMFALILVWLIACFSFKSIYGGSLTLVPIALSTLSVYALMGATGFTLSVGTTMTAAIALGIGIDFAIHTLDRLKLLIKEQGVDPDKALQMIYPSTGRALLFNFLAVFVGFGVLALSYVPPLSKLGVLIAFAVLISFISSMTVLPALVKHLKPAFLGFKKSRTIQHYKVSPDAT